MQRIYLDHAATTPMDNAVIEAMTTLMKDDNGNPSSIHHHGRKSRIAVEEARKVVANTINVSTGEIFFTSSATEANNAILHGSVTGLGVKHIISSPIEHPCVLRTLECFEEKYGTKITMLNVDANGNVDYNQLEKLLADNDTDKKLVSLMHVNNELGAMLDIERVSQLCQSHGALFHSDTVQSVGKFELDFDKTKLNFACGSAHKFNGPMGVGFMYVNADSMIPALITGGKQERNMRAGTENIYGIAGLAKALEIANQEREARSNEINSLRQEFINQLQLDKVDIKVIGNTNELQHPGILNLSFPPNKKTQLMMMNLDIAGISSSSGSACSSGAMNQSHVLQAVGADPNRIAVRFSFSHLNNQDEITRVTDVIHDMLT